MVYEGSGRTSSHRNFLVTHAMRSADDCRERDHSGNMKLDFGYSFHCPVLLAKLLPEPLPPPYLGRLVIPLSFQTFEELAHPIFYPPENRLETYVYRG